jgi:hypothetical protein
MILNTEFGILNNDFQSPNQYSKFSIPHSIFPYPAQPSLSNDL